MSTLTPDVLRVVAAAAVLVMLIILYAYARRRRLVAARLGDASLLRQMLGYDAGATPRRRLALVGGAVALLAAGLLDPGLAERPAGARGPVVLLLDASGSMLVDDVGPRRLDLQRELAQDLVARMPDVPVGVVAFAGRAFSLTPPTRDRDAVSMYLVTLDPTIVTQTGSALGSAIRQGLSLLAAAGRGDEGTVGGTIVLFGDGDETGDPDAALEAARLAGSHGIAIHVVGIGTADGGPVPALDLTTGVTSGFLREPDGTDRVSRLGDDLLRSIARASAGGEYVSGPETGAAELLAARLEDHAAAAAASPGELPLFAWLAVVALLLLMLEPLADRKVTA